MAVSSPALPLEAAMVAVKCMATGAWLPRVKPQLFHHSQPCKPLQNAL